MPTGEELLVLVRAVAAGDRSAFAGLFKHFAPRVKAYLVRSGAPAELAEELAQETLIAAREKAGARPLPRGPGTPILGNGRSATDVPLANPVRSGRKQP